MENSPYLMYDGARVSRESKLGKELEKWERKPDWRPENHVYPRMLYRAQHRPDGRRSVGEVLDSVCGGYAGAAEQWTMRCQLTVQNEDEQRKAMEGGWRTSPQEALEYLEARDNAKSNETAERHYKDARMGQVAQREAAEADQAAGLKQLPSIREQPLARKPVSAAVAEKRRASLARAREAKAAKKSAAVPA